MDWGEEIEENEDKQLSSAKQHGSDIRNADSNMVLSNVAKTMETQANTGKIIGMQENKYNETHRKLSVGLSARNFCYK